jgi:hypothetical protein
MLKWVEEAADPSRCTSPIGPSVGVTELLGSNPSFEGLGKVVSFPGVFPEQV